MVAKGADILNKYLLLNRLRRVLTYYLRFVNFKRTRQKGALIVQELEQLTMFINKLVQQQVFRKEIKNLQRGKKI